MSVSSNQSYQILRTYWRRPLVVLLSIFFVVSTCVLAFVPGDGRSTMIGARPVSPGQVGYAFTNLNDLTADQRRFGDMQTVVDLQKNGKTVELRSLNLVGMDVADPMPDLSSFQNLVSLDLNGLELTAENVDQLCRLPKLDALVLSNVELPTGALRRIGQTVSQLELSALLLEAHADDIPQMSEVKLLALNVYNASPELLKHVSLLPNLEQLTLLPNIAGLYANTQTGTLIDLSADQMATIRNHPTLKEVYADWSWMTRKGKFHESQFLPVRALPVTIRQETLGTIRLAGFAACVLFAILALQLWAEFISPAAAVVPNYLVPHRRVAVGIFLGGSLLLILSLLRYEISFLPSVSLVLSAPTVCCLFYLAHLSGRVYLQWLMTPLVVCLILLLSMVSVSEYQVISCDIVWFLRGNMPGLAVSIIGGAILVIVAMFNRLTAITRLANETYTTAPAFSPWDTDRLKTLQGKKMNSWMFRRFDSSTQGIQYQSRTTFQMVNLWLSGNPFRPSMVLMFVAMIVLIGLAPQSLLKLAGGEDLLTRDIQWMAGALAAPFGVGLFFPAIAWWQRCQNLEMESLRPVSRRALTKQLYLALAWDHWLVWLGLLGLVVFRAFSAPGLRNEVTGLFFLLGIAAPLWILGTNATVLVCKQSWIAVGSMLALYAVAWMMSAAVITFGSNNLPGSAEAMQLLFLAAITAIAAGIGLNVIMYRAVLEREWG